MLGYALVALQAGDGFPRKSVHILYILHVFLSTRNNGRNGWTDRAHIFLWDLTGGDIVWLNITIHQYAIDFYVLLF